MTDRYKYANGGGIPTCMDCGCLIGGVEGREVHDRWHDLTDKSAGPRAVKLTDRGDAATARVDDDPWTGASHLADLCPRGGGLHRRQQQPPPRRTAAGVRPPGGEAVMDDTEFDLGQLQRWAEADAIMHGPTGRIYDYAAAVLTLIRKFDEANARVASLEAQLDSVEMMLALRGEDSDRFEGQRDRLATAVRLLREATIADYETPARVADEVARGHSDHAPDDVSEEYGSRLSYGEVAEIDALLAEIAEEKP